MQMNISSVILTTSLIFMLGFVVLTFLFIVIRRIVLQKRETKRKHIRNAIENDVLKTLALNTEKSAKETAAKYSRYPNILTSVLINFMERIKGKERNQLKAIFNHALRKKTLNDINSWWLRKRLHATHVFIMFSRFYDSAQIMKLLRDKPAVRLAALDSLARVPNEEAFSQIFNAFAKDPDPNIQEYMTVLFSLGQKAEHLVKKHLKKPLSDKKIALLIEITGAIPLPYLYPELLQFAEHPEMEIRTKLARALGNLNLPLPEIKEALMKLARDKEWQVKAQALKSLGNLQNLQALDLLTESLFSPHWYCRRNAGFALLNLGQKGVKRLQKIATQKKDKYAAEMAQMVLKESIIT
jgi:hypothetical protein